MTNMLRAISLPLCVLTVTAGLLAEQREQEHTQQLLEAAVRAGRAGEVQPYLLLESSSAQSTVGAVYTQFVRVARYVWLARKNGNEVELADIPEFVKRSELQVVLPIPPNNGSDRSAMVAIERHPSGPKPGLAVYFAHSNKRRTPAISMVAKATFEQTVGTIPVVGARLVGLFPAEIAKRDRPEFCSYDSDAEGGLHFICGFAQGPLQ